MEKTWLKDYSAPKYTVTQVALHFSLDPDCTKVEAVYHVLRQGLHTDPLELYGEDLQLLGLQVDGVELDEEAYHVDATKLVIKNIGEKAVVNCKVRISPKENTLLSGLYVSGDSLCTQCESTGFRRIVYSMDRPDVLSTYQVTLEADMDRYPVLLANGDCVRSESLENGRHLKTFVDPYPKPSYLFALVAGSFHYRERVYHSSKGREHKLYIYLPKCYPIEQADFAMASLIQAMQWDEKTYQCYYDLDAYYVVAMADFNFGAMENKGLNIFNTSTILADPNVVTDAGYLRVATVVAHEYFHNWTGNRVTLRDWFQLSLKEGLTTYREMRFGVDSYGSLARLDYIFDLTERQFPEDKGPTSHPILPDSYISIENLYTATTYTKGAEVLRMLEDIVGYDVLTSAICSYLQRFDGQAVTIDDFLTHLDTVCAFDLASFKVWYLQKGTPSISLHTEYDKPNRVCRITAAQSSDLGVPDYQPRLLPIVCKLFAKDGRVIVADSLEGSGYMRDDTMVLIMRDRDQSWTINVAEEPVISPFRGLSAPVKYVDHFTKDQADVLIRYDDDPYTKYRQSQERWLDILRSGDGFAGMDVFDYPIAQAMGSPDLLSVCFRIPSIRYCYEVAGGFDLDALCDRHRALQAEIGKRWHRAWLQILDEVNDALSIPGGYKWQAEYVYLRDVRALALRFLLSYDWAAYQHLAISLFNKSDNLTDKIAALSAILPTPSDANAELMTTFYGQAKSHNLVMDRWFHMSASRYFDKPHEEIASLLAHKDCLKSRPNRIMAWFAGWLEGNFAVLHQDTGEGYRLLRDCVREIDGINPSTASRMIKPLLTWSSYDKKRAGLMKEVLLELQHDSSKQLYELITKSL